MRRKDPLKCFVAADMNSLAELDGLLPMRRTSGVILVFIDIVKVKGIDYRQVSGKGLFTYRCWRFGADGDQ